MATPVPGAHSGQATDATQQASGVGSGRVGAVGIVIMAGLLLATAAVMFYVLVQVWPLAPEDTVVTSPTTTTQAGGESTVTVQRTFPDPEVQLFGANLTMSRETRLFLIVVTTGALGGSIHALRSLYWYVGNRNLVRSWLLMYVLLPYVGALLALVLYLVIRGGLLTVGGDTSDSLSAYGLAALGGLAGLYSEQAAPSCARSSGRCSPRRSAAPTTCRATRPRSRASPRPGARWATTWSSPAAAWRAPAPSTSAAGRPPPPSCRTPRSQRRSRPTPRAARSGW